MVEFETRRPGRAHVFTGLDLSRLATHGPVLLRPGQISAQQIADVIGQLPAAPDQAAPRASGTLESHYAPRTPVTAPLSSSSPKPSRAAGGRRSVAGSTKVGAV